MASGESSLPFRIREFEAADAAIVKAIAITIAIGIPVAITIQELKASNFKRPTSNAELRTKGRYDVGLGGFRLERLAFPRGGFEAFRGEVCPTNASRSTGVTNWSFGRAHDGATKTPELGVQRRKAAKPRPRRRLLSRRSPGVSSNEISVRRTFSGSTSG